MTVTDCSSKEPIEGAQVSVEESLVVTDVRNTDDKGRASIGFPSKGSSTLVVSQEGFKEVQKNLTTAPKAPLEVCLDPQ